MRFFLLASGSKGNSIFVESGNTRILIDAGISANKVRQALAVRDISAETISHIILTHAHSDHTRGVGVFANRYRIPVVGHPETLDEIARLLKPGQQTMAVEEPFQLEDFHFTPFAVPHDCYPTMGYIIRDGRKSLAICTDIGIVTNEIRRHLNGVNGLVLESNHDPEMLMNGPYPWHLKERVGGRQGHLSNQDAGKLLTEIDHGQLRHVILAHLSDQNNTAEMALRTVQKIVGPAFPARITVAEQRTASPMFSL